LLKFATLIFLLHNTAIFFFAMNTFGRHFRVTTFGESHGVALGAIIDGCPAGLTLCEEDIQMELNRRRPGQSKVTTPRNESDSVEILSGVFEGKTLGTPIACIVRNADQKSKDYEMFRDIFRPGHADQSWEEKYGYRDHRGGGRSSGRETVGRVIGGAIAKKILYEKYGTQILGFVSELGGVKAEIFDAEEREKNPVRCGDALAAEAMLKKIMDAKRASDSLGGEITVFIKNPPKYLGSPVFGKLEGELARAFLSCGAVRSFGFGSGGGAKDEKGSSQNLKREGISGGISTGDDICITVSVKPTPSISQPQTVHQKDGSVQENFIIGGRHDPTIPPRLVPVLEAMAALVLGDALLAPVVRMDLL